jgi:Ca-activated chloride channel family protein
VPDGEVRLYGRDAAGIEHEIGVAPIRTAADGATLARMAVHAQLQDDATLGPFDRRRLACAYGLVTADTNFLLTVERAPGEKADGMPRLHHVAQMLPAGYGGTGSVAPGSANVLRQPTVWRRESTSDAISAAMRRHEYAAPPMFRRAAPDVRYSMPDTRPAPSLVQRLASFWQQESAYLTPLALHRMLVSTPEVLWDRSYDDLLAAKIDPSIVEWLRTSFGAAWREEVIVASFLACMAQPRMRRAMGGMAAATLVRWMRPSRLLPLPAQADTGLVARMTQALAGIRADTWPPLPAVTRTDAAADLPARDERRTAA